MKIAWHTSPHKLCAHTVAVAIKTGTLEKYVKWYQTRKCSGANLSAIKSQRLAARKERVFQREHPRKLSLLLQMLMKRCGNILGAERMETILHWMICHQILTQLMELTLIILHLVDQILAPLHTFRLAVQVETKVLVLMCQHKIHSICSR